MFASPLCWQINQLVSNLTKKKQQSSYNELMQLVNLYGHSARVFLLSCLLDEVDLRENKAANSNKDMPKLGLLVEEMNLILQMDNYACLVSEAIECCVRDRTRGSTTPKILEDKFLFNFARTTKLSLQQQISISVALTQSEVSSVSAIGVRHLKSKIPELQSASTKDLPLDTLILLINLFRMNSDLNHDSTALLAIMDRNYPSVGLSCTPTACMNVITDHPVTSFECETDMAALIMDLGYSTTYNVSVLKSVMSEALPLKPRTAARLLYVFSSTLENFDCEMSPVLVNLTLPEDVKPVPDADSNPNQSAQTQWNLEVVCEFMSSFGLDYVNEVSKHLDQPDLTIKNAAAFNSLVRLFVRLSGGKQLPVPSLIGKKWKNAESQLTFLEHAEASNVFSFTTSPHGPMPLLEGVSDFTSDNTSDAWLNPNFFCFLLSVGESSNAQRAREMFDRGARSCPELLALVLAMYSTEPSFCDTRLYGALTKQILVPFFLPNSDVQATFLRSLWALNKGMFLRACRHAYGMQPSPAVVQHLVTLTSSLSGGGEIPLLDMPGHELMLAVACLRADQDRLDLEAWLADQLGKSRINLQVIIAFIKRHEDNVLHRKMENGSPLTFESLGQLLKVLEKHPSKDLPQVLVNQCIARCVQRYPALASFVSKQSLESAKKQSGQTQSDRQAAASGAGVSSTSTPGDTARPAAPSDMIEDMANSYFQKIYTSEQSISEVIEMLKRFKASSNQTENEIFACMIHNLFDEYRFFHKYPEKELRITGILFGTLIQHQLVNNMTLGIALRYVLEALRKPQWQNGKMFRFGMFALEQFKGRLSEWPQYCKHVVAIEYLTQRHPELVEEVRRAMNDSSGSRSEGNSIDKDYSESEVGDIFQPGQSSEGSSLLQPRPAQSAAVPKNTASVELPPAPSVMMQGMDGATTQTRVEETPSKTAASGPVMTPADRGLIVEYIMPAGADPLTPTNPPDSIAERIHLIVNNVSMQNLDQKLPETKGILEPEYLPWFGNYLVVKRISTQPNFHQLYMAFLIRLDLPELNKFVITAVFHNVSKLLFSPKITTSTTERSLLKNLGSFLGQMTLARNRPILQRKLDVKELLCQGYETGRLIAVTPFVAKIMEGAKESRVFRPPNPWIMSLMGVLRELYDLNDLKMNIKFEIEVLCKHLGLKIDEVVPQRVLCNRMQPRKDKTPDFNVRHNPNAQANTESAASASVSATASAATANQPQAPLQAPTPPASTDSATAPSVPALGAVSGGAAAVAASSEGTASSDQTVIPNLAAYVTVNSQLVLFQQHAQLKSTVPVAVDRAIREIIQPVVERSVTIACITTKELVVKDFSLEPNEQKMRKAAQLMVANLAGSLAVVTCKEPLRLSMANHLRTMLQAAAGVDPAALEQAVQTCSTENLELGCMLIEKAAAEAAIRDMDESLAGPLAERRAAAAQGQPLVEANSGKKYPAALPDKLRPSRQGLSQAQTLVYDAFTRQPKQPPMSANQQGSGGAERQETAPVLDTQQALAAFSRLVGVLETSATVSKQAGRPVTLAMLGPEHEVSNAIRQILEVTMSINQPEREATTYQFARSIFFKKIMEADDLLKLESFVAILGGLKDECKALSKDIMGWISYLPVNDEMDCKLHRATLILLVRAKVCRIQELDMHIAVKMNGGAALVWVDFAMHFVRQCVVERAGSWTDFGNIFDMLAKAAQRHGQSRKVNKFMEELRSVAQPPQPPTGDAAQGGGGAGGAGASGLSKHLQSPGARDQVGYLLERWIRVWNEAGGSEQKCVQFVTLLHQQNVFLKNEETTDAFFRIAIELCVEACVKTGTPAEGQTQPDGSPMIMYGYKVMDALSSMIVILVKYGCSDPQSVTARAVYLNRVLTTLSRVIASDANDASANAAARRAFDQRPYFRVLANLLRDLNTTDPVVEQNNIQILSAFANAFYNLQPSVVPAFAFAWLELISHRSFMPALLLAKPAQKGWVLMHRILIALFVFMEPFLRRAQLPPSIRALYKGTLRVLLVLLHDFPEFLSDYHFSFCDVIPPNCIQLRNLFLSAFPRSMRLPDPFTPNLKVDQLPEIAQHPRILSNIVSAISSNGLRQDLDSYLKTQQPKSFLEWLPDRLHTQDNNPNSPYNVQAINSLVVYVGSQGILLLQSKSLTHSPVMEIFQALMNKFDAEGRYYLLNAIANQLRYPNSHTHYFSCVLLYLFAETKNELAKEQITRVLLERLIVHRPHPWGLLITFIELIKNARYNFWAHKFTHCSPEIEKVFESVARSCMGPGHSGITNQTNSAGSSASAEASSSSTSSN